MIGIIGANPGEVETFLKSLILGETQTRLRHEFHRGELCGQEVVITTSGMGKVRAAARTQFLIDHFDISRLIFVGVAGALDPQLERGDIVVCSQTMEHDFDISAGSVSRQRGAHWYEADSQLVQLALEAGQRMGLGGKMHLGKVLTGDQAVNNQAHKQHLRQTFDGSCVEMEGAAVAMVCWMNKVPFALIRGISDLADESSFDDFARWFRIAAERSALLVMEMLKTLPQEGCLNP